MTVLSEGHWPLEFILGEVDPISIDNIVIAQNQTIVAGQVLGAAPVASLVTSGAAADAGNTGNGTFTLDVTTPILAGAQNGKYRVVCIAVASNGGEFVVEDPKGIEIGRVAVGATFASQIKFVVADGSTDFAAGDAFTVTVGVEASDKQYLAHDAAATDGSQDAVAIACYPCTTGSGETKTIAAVTRNQAVKGGELTWKSGISAANLAAGINALAAKFIIVR